MSSNENPNQQSPSETGRPRRSSITQATFANLFQRSNSTSTGTPVFPSAMTAAGMAEQRRRLSINTLGLSGTSPNSASTPFGIRRGSLSTNTSDSVDENAVEEEDSPANSRTAPTTPFARRMSFGAQAAMRGARAGGASAGGTANNDQAFTWSEQLRSRAESNVAAGARPSFSFASGFNASPPRNAPATAGPAVSQPTTHDSHRSVGDMPAPPAQAPKAAPPPVQERPKPDHFQERILKGDFYMD